MREIKFRMWYQNQMFNWSKHQNTIVSALQSPNTLIGAQLMQFIGLKDKNGKEIFEGDILANDSANKIIEVKHFIGWEGDGFPISGFAFAFGWHGPKLNLTEKKLFDSEVIGNIYENPELCP